MKALRNSITSAISGFTMLTLVCVAAIWATKPHAAISCGPFAIQNISASADGNVVIVTGTCVGLCGDYSDVTIEFGDQFDGESTTCNSFGDFSHSKIFSGTPIGNVTAFGKYGTQQTAQVSADI